MKYKKIMLFSAVVMFVNILLRAFQILFTIESQTGFFKIEYSFEGKIILFLIFCFGVLASLFAYTAHRHPEKPANTNKLMSVISFITALTIVLLVLFEINPILLNGWWVVLLKISEISSIAFFVVFGLQNFIKIEIKKIFYTIPCAYLIIKLICSFTSVASLSLISESILLLAAYCSSLWFMLQLAKFYNKIDGEKNFRGMLASAIASVIFCYTKALPELAISIFKTSTYFHTPLVENLHVFFIGSFILIFTLTNFSYKNVCEG